jgi:hypothetical protein
MLRKTVIVLAKAAALRGHAWSALRMVARKLVVPTSQAAALFYDRLFEVGQT